MKILKKLLSIILIAILLSFTITNIVQAATKKEIVLVIDPGHGGKMTGAINHDLNIVEAEVTLKIARYLKEYLNEYEGIKVILTHNGLPSNYELQLSDRGMIARNNKADMMISLHINDSSTKLHGAEVFVTHSKLLPKYYEESAKFGNIVLNKLQTLGIANRGVKTKLCEGTDAKWQYSDGTPADYYAVIRYPMKGDGNDRGANLAKGEGIPGVLIEHCFIKDNDAKFVDSDEDIKKLAKADCDAIVEYYNLEKKDQVKGITLNKTETNLIIGNTEKIEYTISPSIAKNKNVKWESDNTEIATVDKNGIITAVKEGTANITVTTEQNAKTASIKVNVTKLSETQTLKINNLKQEHNKLSKIQEKTTIANLKKNFEISEDLEIVVKNQENKVLTDKEVVGTNTKIEIIDKTTKKVIQNYICLIYADVNGDGKISSMDYALIKNHIMDVKKITETNQEIVADVSQDGKISSMDYALIKNHIMDVKKIEINNVTIKTDNAK